ncbi:adenosylcobinamide-GDP ribazoletransferase [Limnochorda pilosa]|uniref:Adenosylcobinamide-GDP ribazoletransferase n=1 Tax=Limnochorda pilosa TaxID=1555112 RepID=A0A0K2SR78_LIMPI|nr:adenosylcobinamide-GDP ribazoletransferase [Limnochorda pilosa]BAS29329.1 cobalamin 5'-phosphate synthase [Limnochorda pilosa]
MRRSAAGRPGKERGKAGIPALLLPLVAVHFLTRLPVRLPGVPSPEALAASLRYYPLVGLALGAAAGAMGATLGRLGLDAPAPAAVSLAALVLLTGNLHLDGLMDTADGLGGARERERALEIMRDSRVGAHGVSAGILALLLHLALLAGLSGAGLVRDLALACGWGRWALVYGACRYPHARAGGGLASPFMEHAGFPEQAWALGSLLLLGPAVAGGASALSLWAGAALAGLAVPAAGAAWLARRLGGLTGDTLGALSETTTVAVLLALRLGGG